MTALMHVSLYAFSASDIKGIVCQALGMVAANMALEGSVQVACHPLLSMKMEQACSFGLVLPYELSALASVSPFVLPWCAWFPISYVNWQAAASRASFPACLPSQLMTKH